MKERSGWAWVPSLYFAEGLPYVIVMSVAGFMYKRMGLDNSHVALYSSLLSLPWIVKPLWSPIVDMLATKRLWIVAMQCFMACMLGCVAVSLPGSSWLRASEASFMVIAFLSATHDIAADGFYILALNDRQQGLFVGIRTTFYRAAMILGQGPLVMLAGYLEVTKGSIPQAWATTFYVVAAFMALMAIWHAFALPRPAADPFRKIKTADKALSEFAAVFKSFFTKPHVVPAIAFMLLYKLPEAQLIRLISPFLLDSTDVGGLGLTTAQVGLAYGTIGVCGLLLGGVIGGVAVSMGGLRRWIMPMAWSMSLTCATFLILSCLHNPSIWIVNVCVFVEQFGYGFGTTAYVVYLMRYSSGQFATAHYAIATGIMSLGMMLPGMLSGYIQEAVGYEMFFIWTMICCVATIAVAHYVKHE